MLNSEIKYEIGLIFDKVSFRKFGNAFRKHIDPYFSYAFNSEHCIRVDMLWSEFASYIIMDGDYQVTEEQYNNFIKEF